MSSERVPIRNIYFLLCYAWDHVQETRYADVRTEGCHRIWDLMAKVLVRSTQQLVKRGLHRDYVLRQERRTRLRGKLLVSENVKHRVFGSPALLCEFDELSADVLPNQILRATLDLLAAYPELDLKIRDELETVSGYFSDITPLTLQRRHFRRLQLHRNMRHYRFVLDVCEFIHAQVLPETSAGASRFRDFLRDEASMGTLFERFVFNFYRAEQTRYRVSSRMVDWCVDPTGSSPGGLALLPTMRTDVCLESPDDKVVLDCKFYGDPFQWHHDTRKFRSGHLYQVVTYLKNLEHVPGWENTRGMLLYPTVDASFDEHVNLLGHSVRLATVDLRQEWTAISSGLLCLLETASPERSNFGRV